MRYNRAIYLLNKYDEIIAIQKVSEDDYMLVLSVDGEEVLVDNYDPEFS